MALEFRKQIECLQAVDAERLEKVIVRMQLLPLHFEMRGGEVHDFVECLFSRRQWSSKKSRFLTRALRAFGMIKIGIREKSSGSWQIWLLVRALHKFSQSVLHRRLPEQLAEYVDFVP